MKYLHSIKMLLIIVLLFSTLAQAEDTPKKNPTLEEMSPEEFKAALKKSHAEIESRLAPSAGAADQVLSVETARDQGKRASLSDKRAYETSAQSRIDLLDYKIRVLETQKNKNKYYAQNDAYKLRDIQSKAREQLNKIKSDDTEGWKINKQALDGLLRGASLY